MTDTSERNYAIRHDPASAGLVCCDCRELRAEDRPELYRKTLQGWAFVCPMCGWDEAPWLVSLLNLGEHATWDAFGGCPPTPKLVRELKLTLHDLLGDGDDDDRASLPSRAARAIHRSVNKRATARIPLKLPARLSAGILARGEGHTRDLGPDGIYLETSLELSPGAKVRLDLDVEVGRTLRLRAQVARVEKGGAALLLSREDTHRLFEAVLRLTAPSPC